jgi:hypothetical protein
MDVAARFLQTAVVIDDRAFRRREVLEVVPHELPGLPTPSTAQPPDNVEGIRGNGLRTENFEIQELQDPDPHRLNAETIIESFARAGIICSVLQRVPDENPAAHSSVRNEVFHGADILVIDWQVHRDDGSDSTEETLGFLGTAVTQSTRETPQQLRLIVVYTGAVDLLEVAEKVGERLHLALGSPPLKDGEFAFQAGPIRVAVLGKPNSYRTAESKGQQVQSDADLPLWATVEFASMTKGLVSNVAIEAMAQIRRATHRLLTRFGGNLDASFLIHRTLLDPPSEANEHLIPLIGSEIEGILEHALQESLLSSESVEEWFADNILERRKILREKNVDPLSLLYVLEHGAAKCLEGWSGQELEWLGRWNDERKHAEIRSTAPDLLADILTGRSNSNSNEQLAALMALKPRYESTPPYLSLGAILEEPGVKSPGQKQVPKSKYWLCIQPVCDAVRVGSKRAFPLLQLAKRSSGRFDLVVPSGVTFIRLQIDPRPYNVRMVIFHGGTTETVKAIAEDGEFWFESIDKTFRAKWLAELKFEHAQRAVHQFATQNARVGLTESEWQRRSALKDGGYIQ